MVFTYVNIALEVFCFFVLLILVVYMMTNDDRKRKSNWYFLLEVWLYLWLLFFDIVTWIFDGRPGMICHYVLWSANFAVYILGALTLHVFILYMLAGLVLPQPTRLRLMGISAAAVGSYCLTIVISLFNGSIFYIDYNNVFHINNGGVLILLTMIIFVLIIYIAIRYRDKLSVRGCITYILYASSFMIPTVFSIAYPQLMLIYVVVTLELLVVFANIQVQREKQMKEQKLQLRNQEVTTMLSQIQPHFLYNTLTSISQLCDIDSDKAKTATIYFSKYLRANMKSLSQREPIPFAEELNHVKHYLWLEEMRFEERLKVSYQIEATDFSLPALTLQPIVENAVRHGITSKQHGGMIVIASAETQEDYRVTVQDDGRGFEVDEVGNDGKLHTGMTNVRDRLAVICGGRVLVKSAPEQGTLITLVIPKRRGDL